MSDIYELAVKLADRIMDEEIANRQSLVNVIEAEVTKWSTPRAADAGPRTDRALISELIHIAAELARGEGFLPTCAEDMSPRLNRADILKTAERQDLQLKDWANRVKQVVDKLSAVSGPRGDVADVLEVLAGRHHAQHHKQFGVETCPAWPCDVLRGAAPASPTGAESDDAETMVKQWVSTLQEESHVTDEDAEDLVLRITAFAGAGFIPRDGATLVAGEQCSRKTAEQIVQRSLCAEPSHNCEESAAVHVRDLIESITSLSKPQYDALCEEHQNEFTVFHVGGCIKCWQESEAASTTHANVTAADTARLAAEEIQAWANEQVGHVVTGNAVEVDDIAAIISKRFTAIQTNHDAERSATDLEAENERLKNAYNLAIQCVEFAQGKRKRGWDIQFVKEQLADAINPTPAS